MSNISAFGKRDYVVVVRFQNGGTSVRTDTYLDMVDMLQDVLMNSGGELPFLVRDKLLPPAIDAWEKQNRIDNCTKHGNIAEEGTECECGFVMGDY